MAKVAPRAGDVPEVKKYAPTKWENKPSTATPITAERLNKIEQALDHLFAANNRVRVFGWMVPGPELARTWVDITDSYTVNHGTVIDICGPAASNMSANMDPEYNLYSWDEEDWDVEAVMPYVKFKVYPRPGEVVTSNATLTEPISGGFKPNMEDGCMDIIMCLDKSWVATTAFCIDWDPGSEKQLDPELFYVRAFDKILHDIRNYIDNASGGGTPA